MIIVHLQKVLSIYTRLILELSPVEAEVAHATDQNKTHEHQEVAKEKVTFDLAGVSRALHNWQAKLMQEEASTKASCKLSESIANHVDIGWLWF